VCFYKVKGVWEPFRTMKGSVKGKRPSQGKVKMFPGWWKRGENGSNGLKGGGKKGSWAEKINKEKTNLN